MDRLSILGNAGMVIIIIDGTLMDVVCTYLIQQFLLKLDTFLLMKKQLINDSHYEDILTHYLDNTYLRV